MLLVSLKTYLIPYFYSSIDNLNNFFASSKNATLRLNVYTLANIL